MCGIAGFTGEDPQKIERMTKALLHRGPDGNATSVRNGVSLGHARLAILDPRPEGNQPMLNEGRTIAIVYNGEIFNFGELRKKYDLPAKTRTDTEVLLLLYERMGMSFLPELLGMFAFAIHDARDGSLFLARDPSGIKPLYVMKENGVLHFASESRALMSAARTKPAINVTSLSAYMRLQYVPGPETLCEGIESLPPGTLLTWKNGTEERRVVEPAKHRDQLTEERSNGSACIALMDDVVRDHLVSDKPVGIFLSGGMDSSILLHHMATHTQGQVRTFTVRFSATDAEDGKRFNIDADLAKRTAEHYGTDHHEVTLTAETCRDLYERTARGLDQPNADPVSPALFFMAEEAKKHVDVVLMGAGGDELFGGYPRYRIAKMLHAARFIPAFLRSMGASVAGYPRDVLSLSPGPSLALRLLARTESEVRRYVRGDWFDPHAAADLFERHFAERENADPVQTFMDVDRFTWLVDESLRLSDGVTMASGLECRVPFLDPRMITFARGIPSSRHVTWGRTKAYLKDAYRSTLPPHLYALPKAGFFPPLAKWMRRECGILVESAFDHPRMREYVDTDAVRTLYEEHRSHAAYHFHALSTLMQLRAWFDVVYDAA